MGAHFLKAWLAGQRAGVLWIEYSEYAGRVFAGDPGDWLEQATRYANTMAQARKLVRTQVLTLDVLEPALARAPVGATPLARALAVVADPRGTAFVGEVLDAWAHKFAGEVDLVLKLRSPIDVLFALGARDTPSFDDLDDLSAACAAFIRGFADKPLAGLLLARRATSPVLADEAEACAPLLRAAKHYGWVSALALDAALLPTGAGPLAAATDLLLGAELAPGELAPFNQSRRYMGGALGVDFWQRAQLDALPTDQLLYGSIPATAHPELVLTRCAQLPTGT
ncbi:MAG: hypothetical protein EXR83_03100 [Gammaproteobacteria bacterium]|nr:hypothetical protein [Gammaproteobacteria bacterium]